MGGTRIIVLQLKEIIKTAVFVLIGLAVILLLIYLFIPRNKPEINSSDLYVPGTYTAEIILHNNPVNVDVKVSKDKILDVTMSNLGETEDVFYPLFQPAMADLSKAIIANQSADIVPSSDYPVTGQIILDAVQNALNQAAAQQAGAGAGTMTGMGTN
ncbi:MAG: hypothetical protein FWF44_12195 [Defluviitaleaceae bacterium]|nr:hypothetical protein [Defluviitaleaceae bacterium]